MKNINSASRVLSVLKQASDFTDGSKVSEVWSGIFSIQEKNQNREHMEISRCLSLMHDEIESVITELNFVDADEFQCKQLLRSIYPILSVQAIMGDWKTLKPRLTREIFLCIGYCRQILPNEENQIDPEDVEALEELIAELKLQLEESTLPKYIKKKIQNHIDGILKSLHSYRILGAESLQSAMNTVVGDIISNEEVFREARDTPEVDILGKIIKKAYSVTDSVIKTEKLLTSGAKVANYGAKALEVINGVF